MRPQTCRCRPPHNLIPFQIRIIRHHPLQPGVVIQRRSVYSNVAWVSGRLGQRPQSREVNLPDSRGKLKVHKLDEIAVLRAVFNAEILMLVVEVLVRLSESDSGVSGIEEGSVVSPAQESVQAVDDRDVHARGVVRGDVCAEPGEFPSRAVVLATDL